ncbi:glucosidase 2 subunit beta-like [Ornithodoros turicata]|uniref:glucosidase 2 subunit beta-like n=1 Tax=Ornithodoros turicata TaxID=34597 RepID=UPI003138E6E3
MAAAMSVNRFAGVFCLTKLNLLNVLLSIFIVLRGSLVQSVQVPGPRGVSLSRASLYDPSRDFTCFDGTQTISFSYVNDDYCDCPDGSDEPGTPACSEGYFHCTNTGHRPINIPSSRVNDGICDCCDASDEYNSTADCTNICTDLGRHAREEQRRQRELLIKGFELRLQMCKDGKETKALSKAKVEQLKSELEEARKVKEEKEALKKLAEDKETEALKKYRDIEDEKKREQDELELKKHQEEERNNAEEAFNDLDLNMDGVLTVDELQKNPVFDQNHDGTVSVDEAKFFLHMKEEMEVEEFVTTGWMIMKPIYTMSKVTPLPAPPEVTTPMPFLQKEEEEVEQQHEVEEDSEDTRQDDTEEDEEDDLEPPEFPPKEKEEEEEEEASPEPIKKEEEESKYDPETQALIDEAKAAREQFSSADEKFRNVENEIRRLEGVLGTDFGPEEEFASLKDQCFEFTDREYAYKLCMFDKASQRPKSEGTETSLGRWGSWSGLDDSKYLHQKYEGGTSCWNGPSRSTVVNIHCGLQNELTSASEPSRCEYMFDFTTPAACRTRPAPEEQEHVHTEL